MIERLEGDSWATLLRLAAGLRRALLEGVTGSAAGAGRFLANTLGFAGDAEGGSKDLALIEVAAAGGSLLELGGARETCAVARSADPGARPAGERFAGERPAGTRFAGERPAGRTRLGLRLGVVVAFRGGPAGGMIIAKVIRKFF